MHPRIIFLNDLTSTERNFVDNKFKLKIHQSNGQSFEDFFTSIMFASDNRFIKIKAWGSFGDRKNDGCIPADGLYYQVFAPENIELEKTQKKALTKLTEDADGLMSHWMTHVPTGVKNFVYVINDKFKGSHPDLITELGKIKEKYSLDDANLFTSDHLRIKFNQLPFIEIESILDMVLPNVEEFKRINIKYDVLNEVINYISKKDYRDIKPKLVAPDWDNKITFNKLGEISINSLEQGDRMINALDQYFQNKDYSADLLQQLMTDIYLEVKQDFEEISDHTSDDIYWEIIDRCLPEGKKNSTYQAQMFPIMAKYFATCDIFEEPK